MIDSFSGYFISSLYALAILKLLRINSLLKIGFTALLTFTIFISIVSMTGAVFVSPLIFINSSNEALGAAIKIVFPLVAGIIIFIYRREIIYGLKDFIYEIKEDKKNDGKNLSKILNNNSLEDSLRKYLKLIIQDIENQIFYSIGFFALLQSMLYFIYAYDYIPLFGQLLDCEIIFLRKIHLLWLIPLTLILTYIYSRFIYEIISNSTFQNFLVICRFGEYQEMQAAIGENLLSSYPAQYLIVIKNEEITEFFKIAPNTIFIRSKKGIYLLLNKYEGYRDFRISYQSIKSIGSIVFSNNYYQKLK
jgi:hypothetical protein